MISLKKKADMDVSFENQGFFYEVSIVQKNGISNYELITDPEFFLLRSLIKLSIIRERYLTFCVIR